MFGFGSSNDNQKQNNWERRHPLERKYGIDEERCSNVGAKTAQTFGTNDLDYMLERFAPEHSKALLNLREVMYYKECADMWEGRYHELVTVHKELLERFDKLLEHFKCPTRPVDEVIDEVKERIEKKYPER